MTVQVIILASMTLSSTRSPRRDAAENREALLAAAKTVLNLDPAASMETIAAAAGLSRRSVYGHFANRDELVLELVAAGSRRIAAALEGLTSPDPVLRLALIASRLWREVESVRVMAVIAVRGPLSSHSTAALSTVRDEVRGAVAEGQAAGTIREDLPSEQLARLVERSALSVLEEAVQYRLPSSTGNELVVLMVLGAVGYGWREARAILDAHPELQWKGDE